MDNGQQVSTQMFLVRNKKILIVVFVGIILGVLFLMVRMRVVEVTEAPIVPPMINTPPVDLTQKKILSPTEVTAKEKILEDPALSQKKTLTKKESVQKKATLDSLR